mmetsp:Transcript_2990/g.13493  ORF Transcript_2990/g.13493 Transcript_2990/m.13493 type:complete len:295 (+) Transcript_2990:729-1613(+)
MIPKRVLVNLEKCGSDSTWIRRRPTAENAPNTAMVMCPCLAPARYTTGMNNAHMAMDMFSAHLGGGCGSSDGIVSIIWKYSRADNVAVIDMTAVQTQPPKIMEPRPKKERTSAEVIRSWSLPMDTLGLTMPESSEPEPASAAAAAARTPRVRLEWRARVASSAPPLAFTAATRPSPRAPKPTLPLAAARAPSPAPTPPSLAPLDRTLASGTARGTGVCFETPRGREAPGATTPDVACIIATISSPTREKFVSTLVCPGGEERRCRVRVSELRKRVYREGCASQPFLGAVPDVRG